MCRSIWTPKTKLDTELRSWLAFATQKLNEISALTKAANGNARCGGYFLENAQGAGFTRHIARASTIRR